jgi:lipopolysaccharide transport system ATP-binding protein
MSDIAIRAETLSKQYKIGAAQKRQETLADALTWAMHAPFRALSSMVDGRRTQQQSDIGDKDSIWALKGVSFEIKRGETVGLIGRNGSGKSTLLKILSRITEPTGGFADVRGRVSSLLEVGTGFQPQLTGRENIYLNGVILGMKQAEIDKKFDQIVDFAEVEKFIDTPVKHYSSGMYLRLAFAVAAHLEPEILLVDEVLAVGDASFQKKCLNKMQDVGEQGRTILFVSHNTQAITRLCERTILLDGGRVLVDGPSHQAVSVYLNTDLSTTGEREWPNPEKRPGGEIARLCAVRLREHTGKITDNVDIRRPVEIEMEYEVLKAGCKLMPNFQFYNEAGVHAFSAHDLDPAWRSRRRPAGRYVSSVTIPGNFLSEGTLFIGAGMQTVDPVIFQFWQADAVAFQVIDTIDGDTARGDFAGTVGGVVRPLLDWKTKFTPSINESAAILHREAKL